MPASRLRFQGRRRVSWPLLTAAVLAVAVGAGLLLATRDGGAESALDDFFAAWEGGDLAAAARLTDGDPKLVAEQLQANVDGLDGARLEADVDEVEEDGDRASAVVAYSWQVPEIGTFAYENGRVRLRKVNGDWRVHWDETLVHPQLRNQGERLGTVKAFEERAPILDRSGRQLVTPRPVVDVGVVPAELEDRRAAIATIVSATGADAETLRAAIRAAPRRNFVPAITLRLGDFRPLEDDLAPIPGVTFSYYELPLAPTREFARALLGTVGPITEEQLAELGEDYAIGDQVGQWGLQAAFERRLAGKPSRRVVIRDRDAVPVKTLLERRGSAGRPLRTTLDAGVQAAAEAALGLGERNAALVAVQPSSGDLLAVANRPVEDSFDRALEGQYPPGSTFKVVTTAALLEAGLDPDEVVDCPPLLDVGGKLFRNFEGGAAGAVPFRVDFAESCNTAFVSLADRLGPTDLRRVGRSFGLGREVEAPLPTYSGSVPPGRDEVEQAASMIGQGRILASPLAMAGIAATVAEGHWRSPRLLQGAAGEAGSPLNATIAGQLRELMRSVVTGGTGTALAAVPGEPIGKSGTAEYGGGDPPPTHAWFIAARGDLAVAVLVEDAPSGGGYAAPVVARFFAELDRSG